MKGATPEERHWGIPPFGQAGSDARWWAAQFYREYRVLHRTSLLEWLQKMKWGVR